MDFEWDEAKRRENIEKHHVDFIVAAEVLSGEIVTQVDQRHDYGETRYTSVGYFGSDCYVVVYTRREGRFRIISARRGGRRDRRVYHTHVAGRGEAPD